MTNIKQVKNQYHLTLSEYVGAELDFILVNDNVYSAIHTFVPDEYRGQGVGKKLYEEFIKFIRKQKGKFIAECSFIKKIASQDKEVIDIYLG